LFFEISFTLANVSSQKKIITKIKGKKKKQKEKKIKTNVVQLHKALSEFT